MEHTRNEEHEGAQYYASTAVVSPPKSKEATPKYNANQPKNDGQHTTVLA
jgi:hypothetical protein